MIYLLLNENQQIWQSDYIRTYRELFEKYKINYKYVTSPQQIPLDIPETDFIWILHYKDLDYDWSKYKAKTIFRISGTSTHPWCYQVDQMKERRSFDTIDYMLSPHPRVTLYIKEIWPNIKSKIITTGYPMADPVTRYGLSLKPLTERTKRIVIGGRLSPDKQPLLAMELLRPYLHDYEIVFCVPNQKEFEWLERYGGRERWENLGYKFIHLEHNNWLNYLADSQFYFSCSLGDTICYSAFEAQSLGCISILPDHSKSLTPLPVMDCLSSNPHLTYTPYNPVAIANAFSFGAYLVETNKSYFDDTWTNPTKFIQRLGEALWV